MKDVSFDILYEFNMPKEDYLVDTGYNVVYLYKINHVEKSIAKYEFSYLVEVLNHILKNQIRSVIFYGIAHLKPLYDELKLLGVACSVDYDIYKWRMKLSTSVRSINTTEYYYEVKEYKYKNLE